MKIGVVHRGSTYTAVMEASSRSPVLADESEREADFNSWGQFLRELAVPSSHVSALAWTTTAAPTDPAEVAAWMRANRAVEAHHAAARTLDELLEVEGGAVRHQIHLAIQIDRNRAGTAKAIRSSGGGDRGACRVLSHVVAQAQSRLRAQGKMTNVLGPAEIRGTIRCRFDPSRIPLLGGASGLLEPMSDDRGRNLMYYEADGFVHITGRAVSLPEQSAGVRLGFLEPLLLFPTYQRSVSCVLEVATPRAAHKRVRGYRIGAEIVSHVRSRAQTWDSVEATKRADAPVSIEEELGEGAAMVNVYIYASVSAPTLEEAETHYGYLESDAASAGIELGRRVGDQRRSFCCTLPLARRT